MSASGKAAMLAAAVLALAAGGCGTRSESKRHIVAGGPPSRAGFPVVLTDAQGEQVRVERRPKRIASAAPVVTEMLFALGVGDRVVGVTEQCDYPPEVKRRPRIGQYWSPSVEKTLGARPDLVIASRGSPPDFVTAVRRSGCAVFTIDPKTLEEIFEAIGQVARIVGEEDSGGRLVGEMRKRLEAVRARLSKVPEEQRPTAFIVLEVSTLYTAGAGTFQDDAIRAAGGRNVAAVKRGFVPFSVESLTAADPDFLLLSTMEGDPERMKREVLASPALRGLSAVREGRLVVLEADPIMRPGPRIVEAVEEMGRGFYPETFSIPSSSETSER